MTTEQASQAAPSARNEWLAVAGLFLLGLLLRLWMRPLCVWPLGDAVHYLNQARYGPFEGTWSPLGELWWLPPLYPWLVALFLGGSTDPQVTLERALLVNALAGAGLAPALWWAIRPMLGSAAALCTAVLGALLPFLVAYSVTPITEPLYMLLVVLLLGGGVRWAQGRERWAIGVPLIAVALYLTRAFGIVQWPLVYLGVWWAHRATGQLNRCFLRQSISAWAIVLIAVGATVARVAMFEGQPALDGKSRYQFIRLGAPDLTAETPDPNYEGRTTPDGLAYAPTEPWFEPLTGPAYTTGQVKKYILRQRRLWTSYLTDAIPPYSLPLFDALTLLLVGAGFMLVSRQTLPAGWRVWPPLVAAVAVVQPLTFIEPRYAITLLPLALPFAGLTLAALDAGLRQRMARLAEGPVASGVLVVLLLGWCLLVLGPYRNWASQPAVQYNAPAKAAQRLRESVAQVPERIFDTAGTTAYYLGVEGWVTPDVGPEQLRAFARRHGIGALVLDERMARGKHNRVLLQFLFDQPADYPAYGLVLLGMEDRPEGRSWRVYGFAE